MCNVRINVKTHKMAVLNKTVVFGKKSKVYVLKQVVPNENVDTQRICIYTCNYTYLGGRQIIFFLAASKLFGGHHYIQVCMVAFKNI